MIVVKMRREIMDYEEIMREIMDGLSGDEKVDMKYLAEQCEIYKNHELSQEILRACGRLMADILPDEAKREYSNIVRKEELNINFALEEMNYAIFKKDYQRAMYIVEPLVKLADENDMFSDDRVSAYFDFNEFFEEILYIKVMHPQKQIRRAEFPFTKIYLNYGTLLVEFGRNQEANVILRKALRWNPVNMRVRNEYMETLKNQRYYEEYLHMVLESFRYAFKPCDLARCYRNLGWYFIEMQMYKEAIGAYLISLDYDKNNNTAKGELYYIHQKAQNIGQPTIDEMKMLSNKYRFPIGPDWNVLNTAYENGNHFERIGMYDGARYCFEILYGLTKDINIMHRINSLPK